MPGKMTMQEFELRRLHIEEHFEAKRGGFAAKPFEDTGAFDSLHEDASQWHQSQLIKLYEESGWTREEVGAWVKQFVAANNDKLAQLKQRPS